MDHQTWIDMNSRELPETCQMKNVSKTVTLDLVTIIASNAEQQLNTDTWDDELNADSRLNADSANQSHRNSSQVVSDQNFTTSATLVKNAVTFAVGIEFSIVLTALYFSLFTVIVWQPIMGRNFRNSSAEGL